MQPKNPYPYLPFVGSGVVSLVYYVCPMTIGSGSIVIHKIISMTYSNYEQMSPQSDPMPFVALLVASLVGKLVSVAVSLSSGINGIGSGLLIPMVVVGLIVGALVSNIFLSLPVGFCLVTFTITIPSGIYVLMSAVNPVKTQSVSVCSLIFVSIPLCMVFIGIYQTISIYISLLVCVVGLYVAMEHLNKLWFLSHLQYCFGGSTDAVDDINADAGNSVDNAVDDIHNVNSSTDEELKYRYRLIPPVVASDIYSTHKRLLLLVVVIAIIKYFIGVLVRCCVKIY